MSSCTINIILNSYVREQAYLPFRSPARGCVCKDGSKGFIDESFIRRLLYVSLSEGVFFKSFLTRLRNEFSSSSLIILVFIRGIEGCLHRFFGRIAYYRIMFSLCLENSFYKRLASALPVNEIVHKILYLLLNRLRKHWKHFFDVFCCTSLHIKMINNRAFCVNRGS